MCFLLQTVLIVLIFDARPCYAKQPEESCGESLLICVLFITRVFAETPSSSLSKLGTKVSVFYQ